MPLAHVSTRPSSLMRVLAPAVLISLFSAGTASAQLDSLSLQSYQSLPSVRMIRDKVEIHSLRLTPYVKITALKGSVFDVFYVDGDRFKHKNSNWYWIQLPMDSAGNLPVGWIQGDDVELIAPKPKPAPTASGAAAPASRAGRSEVDPSMAAGATAASEPALIEETPAVRPFMSDVVLHFEFGKSRLTDEAKATLANAITKPNAQARWMSVALEGHADWTGTEDYNERLGLARAENVRRYLAEQLHIPTDQISAISYGETSPVAPNTTKTGRAQNRRVVIKAGN
jgi:outer membrane protein OmpA-like peptidoglycan-associated protein